MAYTKSPNAYWDLIRYQKELLMTLWCVNLNNMNVNSTGQQAELLNNNTHTLIPWTLLGNCAQYYYEPEC